MGQRLNLRFRQKIFISFLIVFLLLTLLLYPVAFYLINRVQEKNLASQTQKFAAKLEKAPDLNALLEELQAQESHLFFRISLLDLSSGQIYDSHQKNGWSSEDTMSRTDPEVMEAIRDGSGVDYRFSPLLDQEMAYSATIMPFHGKTFILRVAYPSTQSKALTRDLWITFIILGVTTLLLFSLFAWMIVHFLTAPVQRIIAAILPFQQGKTDRIPDIKVGRGIDPHDEFGRLAETLNSLSKRIEQQIAKLVLERNAKIALLESLGEGVIAVNQQMIITYINKTAEIFLDIKKEELLGQPFPSAKFPQCDELIDKAEARGEPVSLVFKPEGKPKRLLDVIAIPRGAEGAMLVLQDKTSLHKVVEQGRDFIANASHELKTPITIIRGFAETLHDHPELSREMYSEITEKIVNNCERMDILVKNLLALASIDEGVPRSRLQECDVMDLTDQARNTVLTVHPTAKIEMEGKGEEPYTLLADEDLLLQALINLIDNAVKYSKPPASVKVILQNDQKEFVISITDHGIGIPHEDQGRIFERFYVVNKSHSRSMGGSGLGLSIVERIVEKHGGTIKVESEIGKGTTFTLHFPITEEEGY